MKPANLRHSNDPHKSDLCAQSRPCAHPLPRRESVMYAQKRKHLIMNHAFSEKQAYPRTGSEKDSKPKVTHSPQHPRRNSLPGSRSSPPRKQVDSNNQHGHKCRLMPRTDAGPIQRRARAPNSNTLATQFEFARLNFNPPLPLAANHALDRM